MSVPVALTRTQSRPPGADMRGSACEVPVGLAAVAVLEDLDANDEIKLS